MTRAGRWKSKQGRRKILRVEQQQLAMAEHFLRVNQDFLAVFKGRPQGIPEQAKIRHRRLAGYHLRRLSVRLRLRMSMACSTRSRSKPRIALPLGRPKKFPG